MRENNDKTIATQTVTQNTIKRLEVIYIVPSRYDDEGYVYQWQWGVVPSNSLAVLKGLTREMIAKNPFPDVTVHITAYDEGVERIPIAKIARLNRRHDTRVVVGMVGVQTGQFARAGDLALEFREHGIDVLIGGFHVSGVLSLFEEPTPELLHLVEHGVTLVQGEAETPGVLEQLFQDCLDGTLKPIYTFPKTPDLTNAATPAVDPEYLKRFAVPWGTIDTSRGCPYGCNFCTVINIQGRKMRCRAAESVLKMIRENYDKNIRSFFFTDDNFARSKIWSDVFNGLIEMRSQGKNIAFMMQVDTQSYKIPNFVEKASAAGCRMAFIGMESVNPESLAAAGKSQNSVEEYRAMVQYWEDANILVHVGYIIGFPADSFDSVQRDVAFLRDHVAVHEASFFMLTPLPGSVDHKNMVLRGEKIDPDLNKYDSFHETFTHPKMPQGEWKRATLQAYASFYSIEGSIEILRRTPPQYYWYMFWNCIWYRYSGVFSHTHPMMTGFFRVKHRDRRRPDCPKESVASFAWRRLKEGFCEAKIYLRLFFEFREIWLQTRPKKTNQKSREQQIWQPLVDLKKNWTMFQHQLAASSWSGRCEETLRDLRSLLTLTAGTLRRMGETAFATSKSRARKLFAVADEIEHHLSEIEDAPVTPTLLQQSQAFVRERLIARYDAITSRYFWLYTKIAQRRANAVYKIKHGRIFSRDVLLTPYMIVVDAFLALRFGLAAIRQEK
ncbi:MAG: radical SAM protein [Planctomycetaceae bacterium]|nr:radical SAM protein [Planctomycetaceae bacterium]